MADGVTVNTKALADLVEKLENMPKNLETQMTRQLLKEALKQTGARSRLKSYVAGHFQKHSGLFQKSIQAEKTSKTRKDKHRIVAYTTFRNFKDDPPRKKGKREAKEIQPRTRAHWFNRGTRPHAIGSGSRLLKSNDEKQLVMNNYLIRINNNKIKLSKAKTDKEKEKYRERLERLTSKFAQFKSAKYGNQKGAVVKGITAHHFIESIQKDVDSKAEAIVLKLLQENVAEYLKKR